jgi:D-galacturonate reductase
MRGQMEEYLTKAQSHLTLASTIDTADVQYNPFYVKYSPDAEGHFDGSHGYGYISLEKFVDAARAVSSGRAKAADYEGKGLPTIKAV